MPGEDVRAALAEAQEQRLARVRRRALVIGASVAIGLLALAVIALFLSDALRVHGGARPALAERARSATTTTTAVAPADDGCRSPLTPEAPLRLWIGGDSLAGSLGPSLGEQTAATGIVQPVYDSRVSSGLSSPNFFDWPDHGAAEMARLNPEVAVFIVGANDWTTPRSTPVDASGEPAWKAEYAAQVEVMLDILEGAGDQPRSVYWVGSPTLQDKKKDAGAREVNAIAQAVVGRHPTATYVDAYQLFSSPTGTYTATLAGPDGKSVRVRTGDGVHLTPEGGDLLAGAVYGPLDAACDLDGQAVPGAAKPVLQTKGSTQVAGTHREPTTGTTRPPVTPSTTPTTTGPTTTSSTPSSSTTASTLTSPPS